MATSTTSERSEETVGDVTYVRTDANLPPLAIIDRSPITTRHKVIFARSFCVLDRGPNAFGTGGED